MPPTFVTLGRLVPREPRDVCLGTYAGNQTPPDGNVGCQVRGREPLVLTLNDDLMLGISHPANFVTAYGQLSRQVARLELDGPSLRRLVPRSAHRLFLVAFSPSATGVFTLRAHLTDGTTFSHAFRLPLRHREGGPWPGRGRRGALLNPSIGENIVNQSYEQIIRRYGAPLTTRTNRRGGRCIYYDIVGYTTGWTFCFHGRRTVSAAGNQRPPAGTR